eukprot:1190201-Prorocentrum_minimum.AAC.1
MGHRPTTSVLPWSDLRPAAPSRLIVWMLRAIVWMLSSPTCKASPGVDCRPANGSLSKGNIRRIFDGIFETPCAEWFTSVDSRQSPTVELKSKAFLAVDSGARAALVAVQLFGLSSYTLSPGREGVTQASHCEPRGTRGCDTTIITPRAIRDPPSCVTAAAAATSLPKSPRDARVPGDVEAVVGLDQVLVHASALHRDVAGAGNVAAAERNAPKRVLCQHVERGMWPMPREMPRNAPEVSIMSVSQSVSQSVGQSVALGVSTKRDMRKGPLPAHWCWEFAHEGGFMLTGVDSCSRG